MVEYIVCCAISYGLDPSLNVPRNERSKRENKDYPQQFHRL